MMTDYHNNNNSNTVFHDDGCTRPHWKERRTRNTMDRDDNKNSNDNVPLPFMPEPDRLDRGGRHHHRSRRQQHHGRHPEQESLQLLDEFMTMERMHNDDFHFSPQRRQQEPQEQYPQYALSSTSRHSWDGPDSSSNRRDSQQQQQQPRGQAHGRHRAMTNNNNNTAVSMDHHESLERNAPAPYGSYGGHGPMPPGNSSISSSNLQSSFEPYGINNNGSNISPHQSHHHYHASEQHQPYAHNNNNNQQQQYQPHYVVSTSSGSTPGPIVTSYPYAVPSGSHHGMPPSFGNTYYGSPSWGPPIQLQPQQQQPLPPPVEYIYNIQSSDVLCGRGGATNSHSGNRSFRSLVKRHQDKYLKAKKRDKPGVAALIVDLIRNRGGRFLRRHDDTNHGNGNGNMSGQHHVLWVDIGNERAREKTCQALREGAPELRRRRSRGASTSSSSDDDNDEDRKSPLQKRKVTSYLEETDGDKAGLSSQKVKSEQSKLKRSFDDGVGGGGGNDCSVVDAGHVHHTPVVTMSASAPASTDVRDDLECLQNEQDVPHSEVDDDDDDDDGPLMIRPCPILMRRPVCAISISELSARDQELYLNDFLPPHSNIRDATSRRRNGSGSSTSRQVVLMAREYTSVCSDHDNDNGDNGDNDDDDDDDDTVDAHECWEV